MWTGVATGVAVTTKLSQTISYTIFGPHIRTSTRPHLLSTMSASSASCVLLIVTKNHEKVSSKPKLRSGVEILSETFPCCDVSVAKASDDVTVAKAPDGAYEWRQSGQLHRVGFPARVHPDGTAEWWMFGQRLAPVQSTQ